MPYRRPTNTMTLSRFSRRNCRRQRSGPWPASCSVAHRPGRLGRRRVGLCQAAGQVRTLCALGCGRHADHTGLRINHLMHHLGDLVIRHGRLGPGLGLIPQAIGRRDGQHHDHKGQVAVDTRLGLLREPTTYTARTACCYGTSRSRSNCGRRSRSTTAQGSLTVALVRYGVAIRLRRPVAPQVDDHGVQDRALRPARGRSASTGGRKASQWRRSTTTRTRDTHTSVVASRPCPRRTVSRRS